MATRLSKRRLEDSQSSTGLASVSNSVMDLAEFEQWEPRDVADYLTRKGYKDEAALFKEQEISGKVLEDLTEDLLDKKIRVRSLGKRLELLKELKMLRDNNKTKFFQDDVKIFNDPIHGHIEMHPLCIRIIDTHQFQRLRSIKQLGCCYLVFPGAAHNRFEHSLGVSHLAGTLCRTLKKRQPELSITEKDVLCVEIAGLCHDLGHGPFSHVFDNLFIPAVSPETKWAHEKASVDMFDHLVEDNKLKDVFAKSGLGDQDIIFIKEQIAGPLPGKNTEWPYRGRSKDKCFLYEIVANKRNGIDVDKWDYFLRDCHNLGITTGFDCHRFMKFYHVIEVEGSKQICARDKEAGNLYDMFHTRNSLYRRAYQHKVNKIIETMIVEALAKANDHFLLKGKKDKMLKMSEAIDDMVAYTKLTDDIILQIMRSDDPNLEESRRILELVQTRQLYKCIGQTQPPEGTVLDRASIPVMEEEIVSASDPDNLGGALLTVDQLVIQTPCIGCHRMESCLYRTQLSARDRSSLTSVRVLLGLMKSYIVDLSYGMGEQNPIDHVRFYSKENPQQAVMFRKSQVSQMLPDRFAEQHLRVYCKSRNLETLNKAKTRFNSWCTKKNYTVKAGNVSDPELMTPCKPSLDSVYSTPGKKPRKQVFK